MSLLQKKRHYVTLFIPLLLIFIFFSLSARKVRRALWYEEVFWNALSPPMALAAYASGGVSGMWRHYFALVGASKENDLLKREVARLSGNLIRMEETRLDNERLKSLLSYQEKFSGKTVTARVIGNDPRSEFKSVTINRGYTDGIEPLMPVVGPKGVVGKVGKVAAHFARVLLITDPNSIADVTVERSRVRALLTGIARKSVLRPSYYMTRLEYLQRTSDIEDGDVIVTSGFDGVFPPGLPVGTASNVEKTSYGVFKEATVVPFENLPELREVSVIITEQDVAEKQSK